jgi:trehalose 6-phosphate synthase/phosphatase
VQVRISPVGLHLARLRQHMASADSVWRKGELEAQFKGKLLILGVDDMDPNKGIDLKCQAIEALLRQHPELVGRVVLLQVRRIPWQLSVHIPPCQVPCLRFSVAP